MGLALTGATGFIGRNLATEFSHKKIPYKTLNQRFTRSQAYQHYLDVELQGITTVVHAAGIAHAHSKPTPEAECTTLEGNVEFTKTLANAAARQGVKTFIYLSTAHVYGQYCDEIVTEKTPTNPPNLYAKSKLHAEQVLLELAESSGLRVVILRMPLVYGPYVKANFLSLLKLAKSNLPLPLAGFSSERSYLFIENLCDAINNIAANPPPTGIYNIADSETSSITALIHELSSHMQRNVRLFQMPHIIIKMGLNLMGRPHLFNALSKPLRLDTKQLQNTLQWTPPISRTEGLRRTVEWFMNG